MEPDEQQKEEALSRILSPKRGRASNSFGEREREDSFETVRYVLASTFGSRPELVFEVHRRSCGFLRNDIRGVMGKLFQLPSLLTPPAKPFPLPTYEPIQRVLRRITPDTPTNAPIYRELEREILKVQGPLSVVGRRYEGDREEALSIALSMEKSFEGFLERVGLLASCMEGFGKLDLSQTLRARALRQGKTEMARIQREGQKDGGLQALALLASLKASSASVPVRNYPKKPSTIQNKPRSSAHPFSKSVLRTSDGPLFLTDNVPIVLTSGSSSERVTLPPSPRAALLGRGTESFSWIASVDTGVGALSFAGDHLFRIYVRRTDGRVTDATVEVREGNYTADEMVAFLNERWEYLGAGDALEAVNTGTIQIQGKSGAVLAVAPCPALTIVFPVPPTGGFDLHAAALTETTRTDEGPFPISSSSNLLFLGFSTMGSGSVSVTVELPVGGSISAAAVRDAINDRITAYQLDMFFQASLDGAKVYLAHLTSNIGHQITVYGSSALSALGWSEQVVAAQYDNRTLEFYLSNTEPEFEVIQSFDLSLYTGLLSGEDLVRALEQEMGVSYKAVLSGNPGSRTITIYYVGPGKETTGLRAWDSPFSGGLGWYLDFLPGTKVSARRSTWLDLLPRIRSSWIRPSIELDLVHSVDTLASFSPLSLGVISTYRVKGPATVLGEGPDPGTIRVQSSLGLRVGEYVKFTSTLYLGSVGSVVSVSGEEAVVQGVSFTEGGASELASGPGLSSFTGGVMVVDSVSQGPLTITRVLDPLTVEARGISPLLDTELSVRVGRARLVLEHEDDLSVSTDPGYESWLTTLFPDPPVPPYPVWLSVNDEIPVQVGDVLYGFGTDNPTLAVYEGVVKEVESRSTFRVSPPLPIHPLQALFSTSPSSTQNRLCLESRGYVLQEQTEQLLREFLGTYASAVRKSVDSIRRSIYRLVSVASPGPFLLATLVDSLRALEQALSPLLEVLDGRVSDRPHPDLLRLEDFLSESGAEGCVQALQQCRWSRIMEAPSADVYQEAFDRLRESLQALLARDTDEAEEDREEANTYPDNEDYEETD